MYYEPAHIFADECTVKDEELADRACISDYNILTQESSDFGPNWERKYENSTVTDDPWNYQSLL